MTSTAGALRFQAGDGVTLAATTTGEGPPVVLLHSFGFDAELWESTGVVGAIVAAGRRAVALDCRGHGRSDRPVDPDRYGADRLALDVSELLDHLAIEQADLVAYSMGSFLGLQVLQSDRRFRRAVLAGVGAAALQPVLFDGVDQLPHDLAPEAARSLLGTLAPHLRHRLSVGTADASVLLEVLRAGFSPTSKDFSSVAAEVLLLCGTKDDDPTPLAKALPRAHVRRIEADHGSTLDHPELVPAILEFLSPSVSRVQTVH